MSGVITGPHFRKFFNNPDAVEIGTMVAVLEVGAFSMISDIEYISVIEQVLSHLCRRREDWRPHGSQRNPLRWRRCFHDWRCYPDIYYRILGYDCGTRC